MNTSNLIEEMIKAGKVKFGLCETKSCDNNDLLYKVGKNFVCFDCVERINKILESGIIKEYQSRMPK